MCVYLLCHNNDVNAMQIFLCVNVAMCMLCDCVCMFFVYLSINICTRSHTTYGLYGYVEFMLCKCYMFVVMCLVIKRGNERLSNFVLENE